MEEKPILRYNFPCPKKKGHREVTSGQKRRLQIIATRKPNKRMKILTNSLENISILLLKVFCGIRDLSFGILFIWKLHQIHFVFLLILLGYQSLFYTSSLSCYQDLISIAGKEFTSHRIQVLSFLISSLGLSLVFIFGSEIY